MRGGCEYESVRVRGIMRECERQCAEVRMNVRKWEEVCEKAKKRESEFGYKSARECEIVRRAEECETGRLWGLKTKECESASAVDIN